MNLITDRLALRPFTMADAPAIHAIYSDPAVMRHVGNGPVAGRAETEGMLAAYIAHQASYGYSFWAVEERASGALIGDAGLYPADEGGPEVELGYTLGREHWGRGYATEAARACLRHGFERVGLDEILAVADPANAASLRVLEKLGMQRIGARTAYGRPHAVFRAVRPYPGSASGSRGPGA